MNNLKAIKLMLLAAVLVVSGACDNFLDVNTDPNTATTVPENLQLPSLEGNFSYEVLANDPPRITSMWTQQMAWNGVPPSEDNYDVDEADINNLWTYFSYTDVMQNARVLAQQATDNGNYAYSGAAKVLLAWNMSIVTDLWNEAPYSEAFNPDDTTPGYDSQEEIYSAVLGLLDEAITDLGKGNGQVVMGNDDLLYGGDLTKWTKLAYTLKARLLMHLTNAPGYDATTQSTAALQALQNGFTSNDDNADFAYHNKKGEENPWFQFAIDGKWDTRNQLSAHYVDLLKSLNDPRLPVQARPVGVVDNQGLVSNPELTDTTYTGHVNGAEGIGAENVSSIGAFYSAADASLNWMNYAEAKFIEAEATFRTQGAASADPIFQEAVAASMDQLGVDATAKQDYLNSLPALTANNALEQIITQKYIANFLHFEVYNDWRRTGYPALTPVTNEARVDQIPVRFPYPSSELQNNSENVSATGIPVGYTSMTHNVWWDSAN